MGKSFQKFSPTSILATVFILAALPILIVVIFPAQLNRVMVSESYVVFHNIAEFFSIMVSLSIFGVGWYTYDQSKDRHALFLSAVFLAIGLADFMHTLSNAAMPAFITPNSPNKSTQFWVAARLFQAVAFLLSAFIYPKSQSRLLSKTALMTTALVVPGIIFTGIVFFPAYMPDTFVQGIGLTPFKKFSEYLVIVFLCVAAAAYRRRLARTGDRVIGYYLAAFIVGIFSEIAFAVYTRVFDTYNVLGHIYKIASFFLIYKGIFIASVKEPYVRLADVTVSRDELSREVEERKRTEEALRESELKLSVLINAADESILLFGMDGTILAANTTAAQRLGMSIDEVLGKKWPDVTPAHLTESRQRRAEEVVRTRKPVHFEDERAGIVFDHNVYPVQDRTGAVTAVAAFSRDITERKRAEEALQKAHTELERRAYELDAVNRELEAFSYTVSHDLKAPLRGIEGFTKAILEDYAEKLDETGRDYLMRVHSAGQRMSHLIEAMLNMARLTRGELQERTVDLSALAQVTAHEIRKQYPGRQVEFIVQKNVKVKGDQDMLQVMLENLLDNAWKFTSKHPAAKIEFGTTNMDGKTVYFVRDDGAGFDMAFSDKLFKPFKRIHAESEFPGIGIGLAIAHRIVMRHNGRLWAESAPEKGATFYFTLA